MNSAKYFHKYTNGARSYNKLCKDSVTPSPISIGSIYIPNGNKEKRMTLITYVMNMLIDKKSYKKYI